MILKVRPVSELRGSVRLPASKSYSIRAILIAACGGISTIYYPSDCDDAKTALSVAKALGCKILKGPGGKFEIAADPLKSKKKKFFVAESGTVLRFLLPLLSLRGQSATVEGAGTLIGRPNAPLLNTLRSCGVDISGAGERESVPIDLTGGALRPGRIAIDGSLSSQFVSGLLIACPRLPGDSEIILTGKKLVSSDYILMTNSVLSRAGIKIRKSSQRHYRLKGRQKFSGLKDFYVPSDYGLAAFLMAACALLPSQAVLRGSFDDRLVQADGRILGFLKKMGVNWDRKKQEIVIRGPFVLKGGTFSLRDCPDLVPIMAVLGLFAQSPVRLTQISHARAKESDRISDLARELKKTGARIEEGAGELKVFPLKRPTRELVFDPHRDHRLAMAFAVLGLKTGAVIKDIECVSKSYPGFVADLKTLGAPMNIQ